MFFFRANLKIESLKLNKHMKTIVFMNNYYLINFITHSIIILRKKKVTYIIFSHINCFTKICQTLLHKIL